MKRKKGMDRNSKRCKNIGETREKFHLKIESRKLLFSILTRSRIRDWRTILLKRRCTFFSPLPSPLLLFLRSWERERKICIHSLSPIPSYPRSTRSQESPSSRPVAESTGRWPCCARTSRSSSGTRWPTRFSGGSRCTAISRSLKHERAKTWSHPSFWDEM